SSQWTPGVGVEMQPPLTQVSEVQALSSLQVIDWPAHTPSALHVSPVVQALPSSQVWPATKSCLHSPEAGSQESRVQTLPSSQSTPAPRHVAPPPGASAQTSSRVQALPSSQWTP